MNLVRNRKRNAFTLLEVLLALSLTVIVIGLIGQAISTTLRLVEAGRLRTERDQLARAILTKIADDVRATIRYEPFDSSGMMKLSATTTLSSTQGTQSGATGGSSTNTTAAGTTSGATSGATGTTSGASGTTSGSTGSSSSSTGSTDSSGSSSAVVSTTVAGLSGDDSGLQIDIGRIPRLDEYATSSDSSQSSAPPPCDVRRVMYYLSNSTSAIVPTTSSAANSATGLIRSESNHASAQYTADTGGDSSSTANPTVVAPEVLALEFSYFDGTQWDSSWDTTTNNGLPQLIKISIALSDPSHKSAQTTTISTVEDAAQQDPDNVYSVVVRVPACDPIPTTSQSGSSGSSAGSSSSSTGSSGSSSSSGSSTGS